MCNQVHDDLIGLKLTVYAYLLFHQHTESAASVCFLLFFVLLFVCSSRKSDIHHPGGESQKLLQSPDEHSRNGLMSNRLFNVDTPFAKLKSPCEENSLLESRSSSMSQ